MSLLDDVSIVVTPNGYKAGELYAVIPSDGAADMDVTRETAATRVDENGLVNYALGVEEVTNGDFSNGSTDWTPYGSTFVVSNANPYNGNDTALFTASGVNGAKVTQSISTVIGNTYHFSCYAQYNSGDYTHIEIEGVLEYPNGLEVSNSLNTWTYLETSFTATSTTSIVAVRERGGSNNASCYLYDISIKEVNNVPRIDYTGGGCPHILAEPQRTNLVPYSSDFSESSWTKLAAGSGIAPIVTSDYSISPSGTQTADRIQFNLNGGTGGGDTSYINTSLSAGTINASASIYLKTNDNTTKDITLRLGAGLFDYDVTVTSEWQRFSLLGNTNVDRIQLLLYGNKNSQTADLSVWGAQVENGSYPTSYIPTDGGTVTRNQDIFTRDGIGSLINSTEGVLFAEMAALSDDGVFRIITLSDGGTTNRVSLIYNTVSNSIRVMVVSTSTVFDTSNSVTSTLDFHKIAIKWKLNDFAVWIDGVEVATDTSGATPVGLDRIVFDVGNGTYNFYGKVKQLQVYDTALSDGQLEDLTS